MNVVLANPPWVKVPRPRLQARVVRQTRVPIFLSYSSTAARQHDFEFYLSLLQKLHEDDVLFIDIDLLKLTEQVGFIGDQYVVDGQRRLHSTIAHEQAHALYHQEVATQEQRHFSLKTFLDLIQFLEDFNSVCKAIRDSVVTNFYGLVRVRNRVKSLNLPKSLFPQSLRPVESLAH
jgi:hypothetical protein